MITVSSVGEKGVKLEPVFLEQNITFSNQKQEVTSIYYKVFKQSFCATLEFG
jgi:hypothetical protein